MTKQLDPKIYITHKTKNHKTKSLRTRRTINKKQESQSDIRYYYNTVYDAGITSSTVQVKQLYIDYITYTGENGNDGLYKISFNLEDKQEYKRPDAIINGRYGFKQVTADLLKNIDVEFNNNFVRRYYFGYEEGRYYKTLLKCFGELPENINFLNENI